MISRAIVVSTLAIACIGCSTEDPLPSAGLTALMDAADSMHIGGSFDSARVLWSRALHEGRAQKIRVVQGRALTGLGLASYRLGNYADAQKELAQAIAVQHSANLSSQLPKAYNALGLVSYQQGRLIQAAAYYDSSSKAAIAVNDEQGIAKASGNLALVQVELGEFDGARAGFESMRAAGQRLDDARLQGNALNNLGMLDIRLGNARTSLSELEEARRLYKSIDYKTGEQNNLGQLASAYAAIGEYGRAFALLDSALAMCRDLKLKQEEASNLELLATLHHRAGDPDRAMRLFAQAQKINKDLDLKVEQGANAKDRAIVQRDAGRIDDAAALTREALTAHRAAEARYEELNDLLLLAEIEQRRAASGEASRRITEADSVAKKLGAPMAHARVALARARIAALAGDWQNTLLALGSDQSMWELTGYVGVAEGYTLRARAHARTGHVDRAIVDGRAAVAAVNRLRSAIGSTELRARVIATHASAYSDLVDALLAQGSVSDAFEAADAARGSTLAEYVEFRGRKAPGADEPSFLMRERLLRQIAQLTIRRDELVAESGDDKVSIRQVEERLTRARNDYESLLARTASGPPAVIGGRAVSASEIQAVLGPSEVMLQYLLSPDRVHIFVVTAKEIKHVQASEAVAGLARKVRLAGDLLTRSGSRGSSNPMPVLASLYRSLIAPVDSLIPDRADIVLVSHGILGRVPFAALRSQKGGWLIADHSLLQIPSGSALRAMRAGRTPSPSAPPAAASIFAPLPEALPGTSREAAAVRSSLGQGTVFVGPAATESALRHAMSENGIVHVATHGELNERNPGFSRIDLYPAKSQATTNDGRLEVHELLDQRLAADLVFLSGCETGSGVIINPYQGGEEYSALAQALLNARVRNVVATLWRIDDSAAVVFAEKFYGHLASEPPARALASAQRELARSGPYSHPRFWAAYQFSGDGRAVLAHKRVALAVQ